MCLYHKHTFTRCVFWNTSQVLWHWVHLVLSNREESSIRHEGLKAIIRRRVYYPWTQKAEILTSVSMALLSDWFLHILLFTSLGVVWQSVFLLSWHSQQLCWASGICGVRDIMRIFSCLFWTTSPLLLTFVKMACRVSICSATGYIIFSYLYRMRTSKLATSSSSLGLIVSHLICSDISFLL